MGWVGLGGLRVDGSVRVTLCPSVSLWPLELALWPLWYSQLSLRGALFLLEQIPWNQCEGCLAASSGRAADGHDDMCVDEPKLMNIRLFLSPSAVFLIKKTDSANNLSFLLREYEQSGKWTCKNIMYLGEMDAALVYFTCCGRDWAIDARSSECRTFRGNSHPIIAVPELSSRVTVFILISLPAGFFGSPWQPSALL